MKWRELTVPSQLKDFDLAIYFDLRSKYDKSQSIQSAHSTLAHTPLGQTTIKPNNKKPNRTG